MSEHPEDLQEATAAALREALGELADELEAGGHVLYQQKAILANDRDWLLGKAQKARTALAGDPGRTFLAHLRRLEAEGAAFRVAIRSLRYCAHGCSTACPHTRLYQRAVDALALHGIRLEALQSSAPPGGPA